MYENYSNFILVLATQRHYFFLMNCLCSERDLGLSHLLLIVRIGDKSSASFGTKLIDVLLVQQSSWERIESLSGVQLHSYLSRAHSITNTWLVDE
jgi:hypothetical protein